MMNGHSPLSAGLPPCILVNSCLSCGWDWESRASVVGCGESVTVVFPIRIVVLEILVSDAPVDVSFEGGLVVVFTSLPLLSLSPSSSPSTVLEILVLDAPGDISFEGRLVVVFTSLSLLLSSSPSTVISTLTLSASADAEVIPQPM